MELGCIPVWGRWLGAHPLWVQLSVCSPSAAVPPGLVHLNQKKNREEKRGKKIIILIIIARNQEARSYKSLQLPALGLCARPPAGPRCAGSSNWRK